MKVLNKNDLKSGEIYLFKNGKSSFINLIDNPKERLYIKDYIDVSNKSYYGNSVLKQNDEAIIMEATPEQKEHLRQCIKAGKYVEYKESSMNKEKICFKSDGTKETGAKIIKALEELKGSNTSNYHGDLRNHYYFIAEYADNVITYEHRIPQDYTLKDIHTWNNTPSKDKPFYVVVTEENKEVLSKWRDIDLYVGQIVGLSNLLSINCDRSHNNTPTENFGNEITFEQFLELYPECKEDVKPKFEVGKWYKCSCNKNYYRFVRIKDNVYFVHDAQINPTDTYSGEINTPGYHEKLQDKSLLLYFKDYTPVPLSEIQKFLPKEISKNTIPEYVECIQKIRTNNFPKVGDIIKADEEGDLIGICKYNSITYNECFKPSTKEAYEAQQDVKLTIVEEFVLPEKWCIRGVVTSNSKNKDLKSYFHKISKKFDISSDYCFYYILDNSVHRTELLPNGYTEITFEQFKKYVLEEKDEFVYAPDGSFKEEMPKYMTTLPKYKAGESTWIKPDWQIEREQMLLQNARRVISDKHAGFMVTPEMMSKLFYPEVPCFQKEVTLYKKAKSKLFSTFVGDNKSVGIIINKKHTSKLITNK